MLVQNGMNDFVNEIEYYRKIYEYCFKILTDYKLKEKIIKNGFNTIKNYSWEYAAKNFYNRIHKRILKNLN